MNLYRSFGNLMEAWVTEGTPRRDWSERVEDDPPSDVETNVRSESVDSGVETASSDSSFPTPSLSVDLDRPTFTLESQDTPMSQSPVLSLPAPSSSSSSSPYLVPNRTKVEQALSRIESLKEKREEATVDEVVRRRPMSSLLPKRHTSDLVRGQRSGSFVLRKSLSPSQLARQMSEVPRRPQSAIYDRQTSDTIPEVFFGEGKSELSPGLQYLEQVCQMLEEYAREQLQLSTQAVEQTREEQDTGTCQAAAVEKEVPTFPFLEKIQRDTSSSVCLERRERPYGHFRQRSASETNLATLHLRQMKLDFKDHNLSSRDLQETAEEDQEDQENQQCRNDVLNKSKSYWRFKFGSVRRVDSTKSQQTLPLEKSSTRRRLTQLFRRRRKTGPV